MKKNILIVFAAIFVFASAIPAQSALQKQTISERRMELARKNIITGLRSDNDGVIEGSMILAAKMKLIEPSADIQQIIFIVDRIASANVTPALRFKAYLVSNICAHPSYFDREELLNAPDTALFFTLAAQRFQHMMLGMSSL
ncbi:MAG: hypothetical protein WCW35_09225 [Bacteroidota bacterium]|jgi:hypothetical protein